MPDTIFLGYDADGLALKDILLEELHNHNFTVIDCVQESQNSQDLGPYVCAKMKSTPSSLAILISKTGLDLSMLANSYPHIRAALCTTELHANLSRRHNNANVLCLGADLIGAELAKAIALTFLKSPFEQGRHLRRVEQFSL
ncbi:MAG: RpiB/LacA/LacB family sugar-phosphate isomerase [Desulfovibrionaceae bacterium]|nr:RpiB/LacA/LacB family sugar-phosphate isomerase [Desulfovibrionaceae bacterium]